MNGFKEIFFFFHLGSLGKSYISFSFLLFITFSIGCFDFYSLYRMFYFHYFLLQLSIILGYRTSNKNIEIFFHNNSTKYNNTSTHTEYGSCIDSTLRMCWCKFYTSYIVDNHGILVH